MRFLQHYYWLLGLLVVLYCGFHTGEAGHLEDGSYVMCAASPEEAFLHMASGISGGINTVHAVDREPCTSIPYEYLRFRTADGTCNHRADLGASFGPVKRIGKARYEGPNGEPRITARSGREMPSARKVSLAVHRNREAKTYFTLILMQVGQLLDHDLTIVPVATDFRDNIQCCGVPEHERSPLCFVIKNAHDDPAFGKCSNFVRSEPVTFKNGTVASPRQHFNAITAFMDASMVYGSDREKAASMRRNNGTGALLKTSWFKGKERLPMGHHDDCVITDPKYYCAAAGDERVNEQPGLASIHLVFHKEHNRLVRKLVSDLLYREGRRYGPHDVERYLETAPLKIQERIYQVIRKVVGAIWQKIIYDEYLPLILGPSLMKQYSLRHGRYVHYDPSIDPSISMEFLTAAFRYGHTLINDHMVTDKEHLLRDVFSRSDHYLDHYEKIIKGMCSRNSHAEPFDPNMASSLTDHLFANSEEHMIGLDLAALNNQRGRDHAIPRYNEMRKLLGLRPLRNWSEFGKCARALRSVYEHVDDVELFTGGTCEESVPGGVVGETFGHILGRQFHDLKFGDRHFYEATDSFFGFKNKELYAIDRMCFSKVLCENADMGYVQKNPFLHHNYRHNPMYKCSDYVDMDTSPFVYYIK